ncbi:thioredoxin [Candidatus Berkelbacteria bacterium CG10_big_fil_rev_8_21_14_0_10_43_13]|uniref:Thioredoxin n=1 Tax=Candidatus Berkelbacteria bacterium CG10_big_fil_rev_8_21_14_0_10_43_13 TaxID=1974514 RepID=A0A2H0W6D0_9BACT|nr:MAG: thioredoxin [Candidatus Berkelbacteria bacterium CG10_big_fil_rev_8_21_14_0_10_43_13]
MSKLKHLESANEFDELINGDKPVLVDFFATWCGPCQVMEPILEEFVGKFPKIKEVEIAKADIDILGEVAVKYNIMSVPTFVIFKKGKMVEKMVGLRTEEELNVKLKESLDKKK